MANIPTRFKRISAVFDDVARARLCQSSGSEHSANSLTDLSDLVDSFFQDAGEQAGSTDGNNARDDQEESRYQESEGFCRTDSETKEMLINLIGDGEYHGVKRAICSETEKARQDSENPSSEGFKRLLMTRLRQLGFDAGLCKCRWLKTGRQPAGEYEYIDVLVSRKRYIVEVSLGTEFTIARPTKTYQSLIETIPNITIIKPADLKKVVRLMCAAMRASLKKRDMLVSPWRKNGYMQAKWFGSYKRTTNEVPSTSRADVAAYCAGDLEGKSLVGFEYSPAVIRSSSFCRKEVGRMHVVGNLKAILFSNELVFGG